MNKIEEALSKLFVKHRIIFWYDENEELKEEFETLALEGIEKVVVNNNQFYIKHLTYKEKPNTKFLLYLPYSKPSNIDNWLLDVELSNYVFQTKQEQCMRKNLNLIMTLPI